MASTDSAIIPWIAQCVLPTCESTAARGLSLSTMLTLTLSPQTRLLAASIKLTSAGRTVVTWEPGRGEEGEVGEGELPWRWVPAGSV